MSSRPVPSAALVAANKRLHHLRENLQQKAPLEAVSEPFVDPIAEKRPLLSQKIAQLPSHLGWGSEPVSKAVRARLRQTPQTPSSATFLAPFSSCNSPNGFKTAQSEALRLDLSRSVKVYPDIALGMLREQQAAAGRLWLLLRAVDVEGSGSLRVVTLRSLLTKSKTPHRLCGWRQLRNLLRQGEGVFWQRDKTHVWLRSAARVAARLGVTRLNGRPVAVPVKYLVGSVGEAKAYLYASFHAGRQRIDGRSTQKPIARETLSVLTGLTAESQRAYERRVGVQVNRNFAIGKSSSVSNHEELIWQQGGAAFDFVDHRGVQGKPGHGYVAWQLPNSYRVDLSLRPKGRQKRINQALNDLFMQGMTGNTQLTFEKRYFGDGAGAVKASRSQTRSETEIYWRQQGRHNGRLRLWHVLATTGG